MVFDKSKFLKRFVQEAREHVSRFNAGLSALEKNWEDDEVLNAVFRSAHTIKGASRMMQLIAISDLAHRMEDVLDAVRRKRLPPSKAAADLLYRGVDAIDVMIDRAAEGKPQEEAPEALCGMLEQAARGILPSDTAADADAEQAASPPRPDTPPSPPESETAAEDPPDRADTDGETADTGEAAPRPEPEERKIPTEKADSEKADGEAASASPPPSPLKPIETVRIDAEKLDGLIKLMGEIVSGHSRARQRSQDLRELEKRARLHYEDISALTEDEILLPRTRERMLKSARAFHGELKRLSTIFREDLNVQKILTGDLQDRSLQMRMLPLSTIFDGFSRTVREISRTFHKKVELIVDGGDTELDKKIIEKIGDPLVHMIRNGIDHGIESPETRREAGKPETGLIRISARCEGEHVLISVSDDGRGVRVDRIKEKALKKKILTPDEIDGLPDAEIINLIFRPGFSSREIITDLSGRGVGMDVVKQNIVEDLKGTIQVETEPGKGAAFTLRLPLTMAIIHVLFIRVSQMVFAVPNAFIEEIVQVRHRDIIRVMNRRAFRLREHIIPIVFLKDVLELPPPPDTKDGTKKPAEAPDDEDEGVTVLITSFGNEKLGTIIDALLDEADMVIKPLPRHMRHIPFVTGCIISGTNEIFNVLHMPRIIEAARNIGIQPRTEKESRRAESAPRHILVVDDSVSTREIEKSILESYGYRVSLAGDGSEGFDMAKEDGYDLIITDVEMPKLDGFRLTEMLRADDDCREVPIILVTSLDKDADRKKGIMAGADAYIVKGDFEQSALIETVRNLLD